MSEIKVNENVIDNWINNIFNRIYKNQEDEALRQIRKADIDKNLKARLAKYVEDAKQIKKDLELIKKENEQLKKRLENTKKENVELKKRLERIKKPTNKNYPIEINHLVENVDQSLEKLKEFLNKNNI